jgi:hypothetical protein
MMIRPAAHPAFDNGRTGLGVLQMRCSSVFLPFEALDWASEAIDITDGSKTKCV